MVGDCDFWPSHKSHFHCHVLRLQWHNYPPPHDAGDCNQRWLWLPLPWTLVLGAASGGASDRPRHSLINWDWTLPAIAIAKWRKETVRVNPGPIWNPTDLTYNHCDHQNHLGTYFHYITTTSTVQLRMIHTRTTIELKCTCIQDRLPRHTPTRIQLFDCPKLFHTAAAGLFYSLAQPLLVSLSHK